MKVRIPNSGGPGNMNQMLKQAQKMQEDMASLQEDLEQRTYTASAGGGMARRASSRACASTTISDRWARRSTRTPSVGR